MADTQKQRTRQDKLEIFRSCFTGLNKVYGTYNPRTGRAYQVKELVIDQVFIRHLTGKKPYGVYLLVKDRVKALAVDFDEGDLTPPMEFLAAAKNYGIATYIESSKSKGFHVWMFFERNGVLAEKARLVTQCILEEIGKPDTEIFPKQDRLETDVQYGNFINAPLFGALVPKGKTVFLDETNPIHPYRDQWELLENVGRIPESLLEEIIEINDLHRTVKNPLHPKHQPKPLGTYSSFGLPPCAQRMLVEGVTDYQRVACFRLAVQLKKTGLPEDITVAALAAWATKNQPNVEKRIITEQEIVHQTRCAYTKNYRACGCSDPVVSIFCHTGCPVHVSHRPRSVPGKQPNNRFHKDTVRPGNPAKDS